MIHALALLLVSLSADTVGPPKPAPATNTAPDKISYRGTGNHGMGRTTWWVTRSGRGHYETTERGERISKRLNAGMEGYERLRGILQPLQNLETMPCGGGVTVDQAIGELTWSRGRRTAALQLDLGCAQYPADAWTRFREADTLIVEWSTRAR